MELLIFLFLGGAAFVVVGAVMGMIARSRTKELAHQLRHVERELSSLRRQLERAPELQGVGAPTTAHATATATVTPTATAPVVEPPPLAGERVAAEVAPAPPRTVVPPPLPPRDAAPPPPLPAWTPLPELAPDVAAADAPAARESLDGHAATAAPDVTAAREAHVPPDATARPRELEGLERAFGLRGLTWVGVGLLFLGVAFFLKYAYDRDWLGQLFGPRLRIATAAIGALALAFTGWRSLVNGMQALGQGLLGGGQALLYLTIYAAFQPAVMVVDTPLLGTTAAFALMVLVTIAGLAAAVRLDAVAMAFLAVLGGFATPVLVSSGQDARDALCAYLLLLDAGVLLVALYRRWRALDLLAFAGTVVLFGGWYATWRHAHPYPDAAVVWLFAFHLVFVLVPFAHHWRHRTAVTVERFALALANVAWTFGYAAWMLRDPAPVLLAATTFGGAALYAVLGVATAKRVGDDRRTRDGFLALAILLLTLGFFHLLPGSGMTRAWFAEAAVLLWLGHRFCNRTTRLCALAVLGVAMFRTILVHLPAADRLADLAWNPWFATLLVASAGLGAFAWIHDRYATDGAERHLARVLGIGAGLWTLLAGGLEIARHADGHPAAWVAITPALAIAWLQLTGTLAFLLWAMRWPRIDTFFASFLPLVAAAIATGVAYDGYPANALPALNSCCLTGVAICALLVIAGRWSSRLVGDASFANGAFGMAQLAVTALATVETAVYLQRGDEVPAAGVMPRALGWVWLVSALGGSLAGAAWSSRRMLALAGVPLVLAVVVAFVQYGFGLDPHRLIGNQRFLFAVLVCAVVAGLRPLARRLQVAGADHLAAAALALAMLYGTNESLAWSRTTHSGATATAWTVWLLGATAVAGAAGGWWRARATANKSLRAVAACALAASMVLPLVVYTTDWDAGYMFVNLRAVLVAAAVATALRWAHGDALATKLRWVAFAVGLIALTAEPPAWFLANVAERAEAERLALFSVTVTWVVTAAVMLVVGLRRNLRPARLVALALFTLTAAKLLLLDMRGAQQLYRILAFVLVGLVFVAASWGYHRVARRLMQKEPDAAS